MRLTKAQKQQLEQHEILIFNSLAFYLSIDGYYSISGKNGIIFQSECYKKARQVLSYHITRLN
jgi:hypothetical protein